MRGEETLVLGTGIENGLICAAGTHPKWIEMKDGRIARFATYMTGEMYALLREHSMIGRPATEPRTRRASTSASMPPSATAASERVGLLHLLFSARAAVVSRRMDSSLLAPYLSGLLTGDEINGALAQFGRPSSVTILAEQGRADLYVHALEASRHRGGVQGSATGADRRPHAHRAPACIGMTGTRHPGRAKRDPGSHVG